jgi:hypothetical protein
MGMVLADASAAAGEGVVKQLAGLLILAQRAQGKPKQARGAEGVRVVPTEDSAAAGEGVTTKEFVSRSTPRVLCGDVAQARVGEESPHEAGEFLQSPQTRDDGGFEVVLAGHGGLAGAVVREVDLWARCRCCRRSFPAGPLPRELGRRRGASGWGPFPSACSRTGRASFPAPRSPVITVGLAWWPVQHGCPRGSGGRSLGSCGAAWP